jgi:glycosyltransferase involved in cell wall biosynthesis
MKIGINATCFYNRPTGATQRFKGIYRELFLRLSNTEFVVFEPRDCKISSWFDKYDNVSFRPTPLSSQDRVRKFLRGLRFWPSTLRRESCNIFEAFNMPFVRSPVGRTALTILDIRKAYDTTLSKTVYRLVLDESVRKCDHIITDSESVRHEILSLYPGLAVSVVYNGVDISFFQAASFPDLFSVRDRHNLPNDFVLSVGHFERRKNYLNLVTAIAQLREKRRAVYLVIVGNDSGELAAVKKLIYSLGVSTNVAILNGLSDFELSCIYRLCKLFVFPSSYEGFGIPILEAMAAGCPMVLSDIPVFKELTQGQGVYFEYHNPESIASAIEEVLESNSERDRLIQYGKERVKEFSFPKISMALEGVYRILS